MRCCGNGHHQNPNNTRPQGVSGGTVSFINDTTTPRPNPGPRPNPPTPVTINHNTGQHHPPQNVNPHMPVWENPKPQNNVLIPKPVNPNPPPPNNPHMPVWEAPKI